MSSPDAKRDSKVHFDATATAYGSIEGEAATTEKVVTGEAHDETVPLNRSNSISEASSSLRSSSYGSEAEDIFELHGMERDFYRDQSANNDYQDEFFNGNGNGNNGNDRFSDEEEGQNSFHLGKSRVSASNVWASLRHTPSFHDHGDEYKLVPSQLTENVKLVVDMNLHHKQSGRLYYAESAFYNNRYPPKYALTVQGDIFRMIIKEVDQAYSAPCGLYFCCHGGDGAHTGVSHDDYVDIRLAWAGIAVILVALVAISISVPWPDGSASDDDIFFAIGGE